MWNRLSRKAGSVRAPALAIAAAALIAAGCSPDTEPGGGKQQATGKTPYEQSLAFAKCMRANGHPGFLDPGPDGAFPNENGSLGRDTPQFKKASAACGHVTPGRPQAGDFKKEYQGLLKYAACMRRNGVSAFPDPVLEEHGVGFTGEPVDENSPAFKAAHQTCRSLAPGGVK
ncbi:hypothetical protein [Bailinhaonella thermotolerans]|uniref:Secreted protein n=1 Tax=Bailinhaonella thermotolerans TaxID=1070861 RepID=A0A3A4AZI3_9ACTN|nr:hypothetical protein [Bailinhaonella thermotolerans]RJL33068.1 hypothetical protein D5H75_09405 [Bailinhaonella thermotolerans]